MSEPVVFGAAYSVYVRAVRLALAEKGVAYRLEPVDVFGQGGPPAEHLARHPFGKIPAFDHEGFTLYETGAITRYVDEAFAGPALQPAAPTARARMNQAISILDHYVYPILVWGIYVERVVAPLAGRAPDEDKIAHALPRAWACLDALEALGEEHQWLAGPDLTLADLHAAPMFDYFVLAPEGEALLEERPRLSAWWARMAARPSLQAVPRL